MVVEENSWKTKLDDCKVILTLLIVLYHISCPFNVDSSMSGSIYLYLKSLGNMVVDSFAFISGYLFWINVKSIDNVKSKMKKRVFTLLIPYLLWNCINSIFVILVDNRNNLSNIGHALCGYNWVKGIMLWDCSPHLWYIFMLIFWTALSPLLFLCYKYKPILMLLLVCQVIYMIVYKDSILHSRFIYMIYTWGGILGFYKINVFNKIPKGTVWRTLAFGIYLATIAISNHINNMLGKCWIYCLMMLAFFVIIFNLKNKLCITDKLLPYAFWMYAIHFYLDLHIANKMFALINNPVVAQLSTYIIVLTFAITSGVLLKRIMPFLYKALTGNRVVNQH